MERIVREAEKQPQLTLERHFGRLSHAHAISRAARSLAESLEVEAVVCFTRSGRTAHLLSQDRPRVPILAFTAEAAVQRRLALCWGVTPFLCPLAESTDALIAAMESELVRGDLARKGQNIVIVGAIPFRAGVHTNFLKLHRVG
jgi:pyruvate kinase